MPEVPTVDEYVAKLVDDAPPLTPEQRHQLAELLKPPKPTPTTGRAA